MAKLIATLEIEIGDGHPNNYIGLLDEMLEESNHWGDFSCNVVSEWIADPDTGETYSMVFYKKTRICFKNARRENNGLANENKSIFARRKSLRK